MKNIGMEVPRKQGRMFQLALGQNVSFSNLNYLLIFFIFKIKGWTIQVKSRQRMSTNR